MDVQSFIEKQTNTIPTTTQDIDENSTIDPPFPPITNPKAMAIDLLNKGKSTKKKMPNEFFVYRREFVQELKRRNLKPKQTRVSTLASISWHRQLPHVKDEYRRLAREIEKSYLEEKKRVIESNKSTNISLVNPTIFTSLPGNSVNLQLPPSPLSYPAPTIPDLYYQGINRQTYTDTFNILDLNQLYPLTPFPEQVVMQNTSEHVYYPTY